MPQNQVQPTIFFINMSCTKSVIWSLLYYSSFLCVLHFNVVFLLCRSSPLIFDVFPSRLIQVLDMFPMVMILQETSTSSKTVRS